MSRIQGEIIRLHDLQRVWEACYAWAMGYGDVLDEVEALCREGAAREAQLEVLTRAGEPLLAQVGEIQALLGALPSGQRQVKLLLESALRLLGCTQVRLQKMSILPKVIPFFAPQTWDPDLTDDCHWTLNVVRNNLEEAWVAYNQSYARLLLRYRGSIAQE